MKPIKGIKAFEEGLKCKDFQFEVNKEFIHDGKPVICESGFHFCENPLDVLNYYNLCDSEFAEVESLGDVDRNNGDSKVCTNRIKIGAKIDLKTFIKASFDFLWEKCSIDKKDSSQLASSGDYSQLASSGDYSKLASSGDSSKLASSGYSSQLASSGNSSQLASSGDYSKLASSGDYSQLASSGYSSKLASSGDSSKLASSGYSSQLASSGYSSQLEINGKNSVGANIGYNGKIKGVIGSWITLAEYNDKGECVCVKSAKIDGKKLKENIWYILKNNKFIESKN
ncbi:MAG: hypothetical protein WC139_13270 [Candidatus Kapaibacterium sp.]